MPVIAVLGLGSIGLRHARNLLGAGCRVRGYDPDPSTKAALVAIGGEILESREQVLDGASAVVIATPNGNHLDDIRTAVGRGLHLFVEKPLAHTDRGLDSLFDEAETRGLIVFAGFNLRFNPAVQALREMLSSLGSPLWARFIAASYLPDWRKQQDYRKGYAADPLTGGVLFDIIHEFDLANHLLGPAETHAATARNTGQLEITSDDCADVMLSHEGGVVSAIHLDYVTRPAIRMGEIACTGGFVRLDIRNRALEVKDTDGRIVRFQSFPGSVSDDYRAEMDTFLACLRGEAAPPCGGREALGVLRQVLVARRMGGLVQEGA